MESRTASDRLPAAFGFTAEELALNSTGRLSTRQQELLEDSDRGSRRWTWIASLVMLLTIGGMGFFAIGSTDDPPSELYVAFGAVAGVAILLFGVSAVVGRRRFADVREGRISAADGVARTKEKRTTSEHGGVTLYRLKIGSTRFALPNRQQLAAFDDGAPYRVYYVKAPGSPIVLSARAR